MKLNDYYQNLEWRRSCAEKFLNYRNGYTILDKDVESIHFSRVDFFVWDWNLNRVLAVMLDGGEELEASSYEWLHLKLKQDQPRLEKAARWWRRKKPAYKGDDIGLARIIVFGKSGNEPNVTMLKDAIPIKTFDRVYGE